MPKSQYNIPMKRHFTRVDHYLLRQVAIAAAVITLSLTFIVWITQSLKLVDFIVNRGVPMSTFVYLAILTMPNLLPVILPLTSFAAVLFVFYRLSADSELVVMHSGGLSPAQISRATILFALIMTALTYSLTLYLTPLSQTAFKNKQFELRNDYSMTLLEEGVFTQISKGITVFIRERNSDGSLSGIMVHDSRDNSRATTVLADKGTVRLDRGNPVISVINGSRQVLDKKSGTISVLYFDAYTLNLNQIIQQEADRRSLDPKEMSLDELLFPNPELNRRTQLRYKSLAHQRLVSPLSILCFTFIALAAFRQCSTRRQGIGLRLTATVALVIALQGILLFLYNALGIYDEAMHYVVLTAVYLLPISVILYCIHLLRFKVRDLQLPDIPADLQASGA